jgi:hypothetical protein
MRRRALVLVPSLALAVLLVGGLWPSGGGGRSSSGELSAVSRALGPHPAEARGWISVPFSVADASLKHNDRHIFYRATLICTAGEQVKMVISTTGVNAQGQGRLVSRCTGDTQDFEVRVVARGPNRFSVGETVEFEGWAGTFHRGQQVGDDHTWHETAVLRAEDGPRRRY